MFQLFRNVSKQNWNKLRKKWKYQAPFLVFRNTETMDYIGKKLKRTEIGRKLTKSKCFSCFEMFRNKIETSSGKSENTRPHFRCFETLKQWLIQGKNWNGLKHYKNWISPNISVVSKRFKTFRNIIQGKNWNRLKQEENRLSPNVSVVSKQNWNKLWKKCKYQAPFLVFRNTETMDYIGKKLKWTETGRKLTKSKCFSCFETIPNKIKTSSGKSENTRPHFWCFETLKQWII